MRSAYRYFAGLLAALVFLVGLSLGGSWYLRYTLIPESIVAKSVVAADQADSRVRAVHAVRLWTTRAQGASLLLCTLLCGFGLHLRYRAGREELAREEAERTLDRERRALERRVEDRTRELRREVEERTRAEELNRGQKQVLEMMAGDSGQSTEEILRHLTATVASQRRTWECALHLLDKEENTLRLVASSEVSERLGRYLASIGRDFPDAPESKACSRGEIHVVEKMTDVRRPWSELLVANGIYSAWSVPFQLDKPGEVGGTFTVYSRLQFAPSERELEMTETAAKLASLVIEHRRIHAELYDNAYRDSLTCLPNRRAGEREIEAAVQRAEAAGEQVAVLWIDLDRFKRVNDQHGHSAGDHVLRCVAQRVARHPAVNGMAARMGGDEFLVLLTGNTAAQDAPEVARQLLDAIAEPIAVDSITLTITASIGISVYPRDGAAIDLLERNADAAMYRAKAAGSGSCIYSPAMSAEVRQRIEIEEALSTAIERGHLWVAFQPLYTSGSALLGFEALLRFRHPVLGDVPPSQFIPVAEETRLIESIGDWVLRETCRQLRKWHNAGLPWVRMSVNISAIQFVQEDFAETVASILSEYAVPAEYFTLELTESVMMEDYRAVTRQMSLLKTLGVRIAMDDFGTGYSSLSYLHRLPIDVLKIDRSFVERLPDPDGTRPIVEAIISMARHLGLSVVAEGVETRQQHHILQEAGCDAVQGYLFARPMPSHDAEQCLLSSCASTLIM